MIISSTYALSVFVAMARQATLSLPSVLLTAQLTTEELNAKVVANPASPGDNVDEGSVFSNLANANNDGQFFIVKNGVVVFEKPSSETVKGSSLLLCSDLSFTGIQNSS